VNYENLLWFAAGVVAARAADVLVRYVAQQLRDRR